MGRVEGIDMPSELYEQLKVLAYDFAPKLEGEGSFLQKRLDQLKDWKEGTNLQKEALKSLIGEIELRKKRVDSCLQELKGNFTLIVAKTTRNEFDALSQVQEVSHTLQECKELFCIENVIQLETAEEVKQLSQRTSEA